MKAVKYVGTASRRVITDKEWEQAGVSGEDTVVWDNSNGFTVDASKLSQAALDAIKPDPYFIILGEDKVAQEVTVDVDLAREYEDKAKGGATSADGSGLDEEAAPAKKRKA